MACRVAERPCVGVSCGNGCGVCAVVYFFFLLFVSLGYSLTARLYLHAYYTSAQVAAITAVTSLFALSHHLLCYRSALCCSYRGFYITQSILNILYLLCCTVSCIGYVLLSVFSVHYNFDYIASVGFAALSAGGMFYLCTLTLSSSRRGHTSDYDVDIKFVWQSDETGLQSDMDLHESSVDITPRSGTRLMDKPTKAACTCASCCTGCLKLMFGTLYTLVQLVVIVIFALVAANPVLLSLDINDYRDGDDLVAVDLKDHYPKAMFIKCRGSGNDTIMLENDVGVTGYMQWDYLPHVLGDNYRVCVYNRRGYGWSETFENDDITTERSGQKWLKNQADYFYGLLKKSDIHPPVYYAAHGLGAYIMTQVALDYPDVIKGLVYIDALHSTRIDFDDVYVELMCNLNAMSIQHVLTLTSWYDVTQHVPALELWDGVDGRTRDQIRCDLRQSYYLPTYQRERDNLKDERLDDVIGNHVIEAPVLFINAHCKDSRRFPVDKFSQWNETLYVGLTGTSHEEIMFSADHVMNTAALIQAFINYTQQHQSLDNLDTFKNISDSLPSC